MIHGLLVTKVIPRVISFAGVEFSVSTPEFIDGIATTPYYTAMQTVKGYYIFVCLGMPVEIDVPSAFITGEEELWNTIDFSRKDYLPLRLFASAMFGMMLTNKDKHG